MKVAITWAVAALLLAMIGSVGGAAAGTNGSTIFVANLFNVTAYPAGSNGDVAPIAVTTDMVSPSGIATDATGRIYVTNGLMNTVTVYAANANGNVPPIAVIGGSNTRLANPTAIALDAGGKIYVLNSAEFPKGATTVYSNSAQFPTGNITVYPPLATGTGILNEAPVATIDGSKTLLDDPAGLAVDSDGNLYVANAQGNPFAAKKNVEKGSVTVYRAGSNGNVAPIATISGGRTGLSYPLGIALDSSGKIFVTNTYTGNTRGSPPNSSITVYPAGSNGNAAPIAVIAGENTDLDYPQGIALDSSGNLYVEGVVSGVGNSVNVYPAGSNGNVSPAAIIVGADTELDLPIGIALDSGGNIYVSNGFGGPTQRGSVTVYRAGSSGDAVPINVITSNDTGIHDASSIAVDSSGNIYVANDFAFGVGGIDIYPAGSYAAGPPIATITGDNTELSDPFGVALDSSGNIYVLNRGDNAIDNAITVYPAGSNGDVTPSATFTIDQSGESFPTGMAVGGSGAVYIANQGGLICNRRSCHQASPDNVAVYGAGSDGSAKPIAVISGRDTKLASPSAIAVDQSGNIYVTNEGPLKCKCDVGSCSCFSARRGTITVYPPASNGNVTPVATISGNNTGIGSPRGITLDSSGNICVLNDRSVVGIRQVGVKQQPKPAKGGRLLQVEYGPKVDPILIFAPGSHGDVAPIAALGGPFTGLFDPTAIAVGPAGP
jgi:sugar lactone lactonase YvrE